LQLPSKYDFSRLGPVKSQIVILCPLVYMIYTLNIMVYRRCKLVYTSVYTVHSPYIICTLSPQNVDTVNINIFVYICVHKIKKTGLLPLGRTGVLRTSADLELALMGVF